MPLLLWKRQYHATVPPVGSRRFTVAVAPGCTTWSTLNESMVKVCRFLPSFLSVIATVAPADAFTKVGEKEKSCWVIASAPADSVVVPLLLTVPSSATGAASVVD